MEAGASFWTIGHSTRTLQEFVELLGLNGIGAVADVRRFPGSRKYPHFAQDNLAVRLREIGVEYVHFPELGGRRRPRADSDNTVWRSASFRGYADYMGTGEFMAGIERLSEMASSSRVAIMCSEAVWWRCHRALISDFLKSRGADVRHILSPKKTEIHPYTSAARIVDGKLSYSQNE